jgi:glycosyltransferase involved in cell wall biosynthesis
MGRLSHEKGVETLLEVANGLPYKLIIIGEGPLEQKMKSLANKNVEFTGFKQWEEIKELVGNARFSVMPSEWYENNPLSIIESLCLGTPVLGAQIGGIPELIEEGVTGMCFESRNTEDLKKKIEAMFSAAFNHAAIAQRSQEKYNAERNYKQLITIYKEIN